MKREHFAILGLLAALLIAAALIIPQIIPAKDLICTREAKQIASLRDLSGRISSGASGEPLTELEISSSLKKQAVGPMQDQWGHAYRFLDLGGGIVLVSSLGFEQHCVRDR